MPSRFEPIAIIGQGCVLPGALTPAELWDVVASGKDLLQQARPADWRVDRDLAMCSPGGRCDDRTWSDRGGYVDPAAFGRAFDPTGFLVDREHIDALDPLTHWVLHASRAALTDAGLSVGELPAAGAVFGNLSYPSHAFAAYAERAWLDDLTPGPLDPAILGGRAADLARVPDVDPINRFMSGLPAHILAAGLGLSAGAHTIDAACASSLYAMKLACDRLQDRDADIMIAGGVNRADDFFLHIGFCALQAMSRSGQSRPFHREADGLVPAEGAAFVVLKRLADAERDGDSIAGVIRGVGLSNDGRGRGLLAPAEVGQTRALRNAYQLAGFDPASVSLVECHATGTPVGDATEVRTMARVFAEAPDLPVGSLKSNLGHLITASGAAGLLKMVAAMEHGTRPPTLHVDEPLDMPDGPLRLLREAEPWTVDGPRRAAVSNFGFGGNNAHLIVEQHAPSPTGAVQVPRAATAPPAPIAIVGVEVIAGDGRDGADFARDLFSGATRVRDEDLGRAAAAREVSLPLMGVRFPPSDLEQSMAQQLLVLRNALDLQPVLARCDPERTSVLVGMQCDAAVARNGARWRVGQWARDWTAARGLAFDEAWVGAARDGLDPLRGAAGVVGAMPNIPANRLCSQFDLQGPSFTVSSEELSGVVALRLAIRALRAGEVDAAIVGAVDMCAEEVHKRAADAVMLGSRTTPGDASVMLVCKRLADAREAGDVVLALVDVPKGDAPPSASEGPLELTLGDGRDEAGVAAVDLAERFGHAHSAAGLLAVAAGALACHHRASPVAEPTARPRPWLPHPAGHRVSVHIDALGGQSGDVSLWTPPRTTGAGIVLAEPRQTPALQKQGAQTPQTQTKTQAQTQTQAAQRTDAIGGELAFVFTGPAGSYRGMGAELLLAFPELRERILDRTQRVREAAGWVYDGKSEHPQPSQMLWGSSYLSQLHAAVSREILGLKPQAGIGFCSGESNALFGLGAWNDLDVMMTDIQELGVFTRAIGGEFQTLRAAWGDAAPDTLDWVNWRVLADADAAREAVANEPLARLTIINAPGDIVIGGQREACDRVVQRLGRDRAQRLGYDVALHCPEIQAFAEPWRALHHRETTAVEGVRFYSGATCDSYTATADAAADAILGMAVDTWDFPALIERAWDDGVRVFVEHGPRDGCAKWIRRILGSKPHVSVALDRSGRNALEQLLDVAQTLRAAGVEADVERVEAAIALAHPQRRDDGPSRSYPAHLPRPALPALPAPGVQLMPPAPWLPPVTSPPVTSPPVTSPPVTSHAVAAATPVPNAQAPVADRMPSPPAASAPPPPAQTPGPPMTAPPPTNALAASEPGSSLAHRLAETHQAVASAHKAYLEQSAVLHEHFMAQREAARQALLAAAAGQPFDQPLIAQPLIPQAPVIQPAITQPAIAQPPVVQQAPLTPPTTTTPTAAAPAIVARAEPPAPTPARPAPPVAAAAAETVAAPTASTGRPSWIAPPGLPTFDREQLSVHASGRIGEIFGPLFDRQDDWPRQVRMPEGLLLLADRVTGIDAEAGSMSKGTIWTETDVTWDSWFLNQGRMPAGIMVESGQADLMLVSWLGADFENLGERAYRLLGCDLTFHGELPKPGETLQYEIHIDGHARTGPMRLFFFHYDCRVDGELRLTVRNGQAGFFSTDELAGSGGVIWDPRTTDAPPLVRLDPPRIACERTSFDVEAVAAYAAGDVLSCFGPGFDITRAHVRTPRIQDGRMLLLDRVTEFDPKGGPWGRGYLRVENDLTGDEWYLDGHFKDDPCMPGTLMSEGCFQALAFYVTAMGYTLDKDGWRFEPAPGETFELRCRGQVTTDSRALSYEVFVTGFESGPIPTLRADVLGSADGLKIFHGRDMAIRLVPDWPITSRPELLAEFVDPEPVADWKGFEFGYASLLACAWGKPSDAFGPLGLPFDTTRHIARLPGPPYHFMSRVTEIQGSLGEANSGDLVEIAYDIPSDSWYFDANCQPTVPYCVLLEAVLQPCGWLAVFGGGPLASEDPLYFRNLDGAGIVHRELPRDCGTLRTRARLTGHSKIAGMIIVNFDVVCTADSDGEPVYTLKTAFGFFPGPALAQQVGVGTSDADLERIGAPSEFFVDLTSRPARYCEGTLRLAAPELLMLDRVTGYWPEAGEAGLGRARGEKDVHVDEWFFKAHFYQDPVQPGSLGIEALLQLLQFAMMERGLGGEIAHPRFESIAVGREMSWKYRGQVIPSNELISSEVEILEIGEDDGGVYAIANGSLWCDGKRIYSANGLAMRIVAGEPEPPRPDLLAPATEAAVTAPVAPVESVAADGAGEEVLSEANAPWLSDHRPTFARPALPFMSVVDRLAAAATRSRPGTVVAGMTDVSLSGWIAFDGPRRLRTRVSEAGAASDQLAVALEVWRDNAARPELARFQPTATGTVILAAEHPVAPATIAPLKDGAVVDDPYRTGALFHGPAFHYLRELRLGGGGSSALLDVEAGSVPPGTLGQGLLDALLHAIPHDELSAWSDEIAPVQVGYPLRMPRLTICGPAPSSGQVRVEARLLRVDRGPDGIPRFPVVHVQASTDAGVWVDFELVEVLMPAAIARRADRVTFLRERQHTPGVGVSTFDGSETVLDPTALAAMDWLEGTIASLYGHATRPELAVLAVQDHVAQRAGVHPSMVEVAGDLSGATAASLPLTRFQVEVTREGDAVRVRDGAAPTFDLSVARVNSRATSHLDRPWLGEDIFMGMCDRFVDRYVVQDPAALRALDGQPLLLLGNHQIQVESLLFPTMTAPVLDRHIVTIAKSQHETGWVGPLVDLPRRHPHADMDNAIVYFDQSAPESMFALLANLERGVVDKGHSVFLHVEGELGLTCRKRVSRMSSVFVDFAARLGLPIVPVRFTGGLPVDPLRATLDFPVGYGRQTHWIGAPIDPAELASLPLKPRTERILSAINELGPPNEVEVPARSCPDFTAAVADWRRRVDTCEAYAVVLAQMELAGDVLSDEGKRLLAAIAGKVQLDPEDAVDAWLGEALQLLAPGVG